MAGMTPAKEALAARIEAFIRAQLEDESATVADVKTMPGHSGLSYGFRVPRRVGGDDRGAQYVLRLAPPGVRHKGPTDVLRQARVLLSLAGTAVPVPRVLWCGDDPRWFGGPYFVSERLPGATLGIRTEQGDEALESATFQRLAAAAIGALVAVHRLHWERHLPQTTPLTLREAVCRWDHLWERSADPALVSAAPAVRERLLATIPENAAIGLTHGDFQWTNLLFERESLVAVLDWELAGAGAVLNDLGWLMLFSDPLSWAHTSLWRSTPSPEWLAETYATASGAHLPRITWHWAWAGYTFAIIAGFNLMLHRRGKRIDEHYEQMVPSIPRMLERAGEILQRA
jgi:aminoglycoside phosphotransferase (APT) family kinase protein